MPAAKKTPAKPATKTAAKPYNKVDRKPDDRQPRQENYRDKADTPKSDINNVSGLWQGNGSMLFRATVDAATLVELAERCVQESTVEGKIAIKVFENQFAKSAKDPSAKLAFSPVHPSQGRGRSGGYGQRNYGRNQSYTGRPARYQDDRW